MENRIVYVNGSCYVRADRIKEGDLLDLEGDLYADPEWNTDNLTYEFQEVFEIERERDDCIVLHTSYGSFGFPPDHLIEVSPEETFE